MNEHAAMISLAPDWSVPVEKLIGKRVNVYGISGSGKTNTMHVFAEQMLGAGIPMTIVDPMRQFVKLRDVFPVIVAGRGKSSHIEVTEENAAALARFSFEQRVPVVLNMKMYHEDREAIPILLTYLESLWQAILMQPEDEELPYALFVDEAQNYAPQQGVTPLSDILIDIAKRGRHQKLSMVTATQRFASTDKNVSSQSNLLISHLMRIGNDVSVIRDYISLTAADAKALIRSLDIGEAIVIGDMDMLGTRDEYVRVKVHESLKSKGTEGVEAVTGTLKPLDDALLDQLRAAMEKPVRRAARSIIEQEDVEVLPALDLQPDALEELTHQVAELRATVESMRDGQVMSVDAESRLDHIQQQIDHLVDTVDAITPIKQLPLFSESMYARRDEGEVRVTVTRREVEETRTEHRSSKSLQIAINRQQGRFDKMIIAKIRSGQPIQRRVLGYLMDHAERSFNRTALAAGLDYAEDGVQRAANALYRIGLVGRLRSNDQYYWRFDAPNYLRNEYPDLDANALVERLSAVVGR